MNIVSKRRKPRRHLRNVDRTTRRTRNSLIDRRIQNAHHSARYRLGLSTAHNLGQQSLYTLRSMIPAVLGDFIERPTRNPLGQRSILKDPAKSDGERRSTAWLDEHGILTIAEHFAKRWQIRRDNWPASSHVLEQLERRHIANSGFNVYVR